MDSRRVSTASPTSTLSVSPTNSGEADAITDSTPPTSKPGSINEDTKAVDLPLLRCPYDILDMRRNEAQESYFPKDLELCFEWQLEYLEDGSRTRDPVTAEQIEWAYNILKNDETRIAHESSARTNKCSCISSWERLSDEDQAFLIKNQDNCHRVPEASNPDYDHSRDYPLEDTDRSTWEIGLNLFEHQEFCKVYNRIWRAYVRRLQDDDQPRPCIYDGSKDHICPLPGAQQWTTHDRPNLDYDSRRQACDHLSMLEKRIPLGAAFLESSVAAVGE